MRYRLTVAVAGNTPEVVGEALEERGKYVFDTHPDGDRLGAGAAHRTIKARMRSRSGRPPEQTFLTDQPLLTQLLEPGTTSDRNREAARRAQQFLGTMRFPTSTPTQHVAAASAESPRWGIAATTSPRCSPPSR